MSHAISPSNQIAVKCILGVDIGSTSVKAALIDDVTYKVIAQCSRNTNANCMPMFPSDDPSCMKSMESRMREQNPRQIISALMDCLGSLSTGDSRVQKVAICCQMHGIMFWNDSAIVADIEALSLVNETHLSNLVTWMDQRCSSKLLDNLQRISAGPIHQGYGFASMASIYTSDKSLLTSGRYTHAGTIGDFVMQLFTQTQLSALKTSSQLAQSFGFFDIETRSYDKVLLQQVFGSDTGQLIKMLPEVNDNESFMMTAKNSFLFRMVRSLFTNEDADVTFYPPYGDSQCGILAALCQLVPDVWVRRNRRIAWDNMLSQTQCVINLDTSLQIAVVLPNTNEHTTALSVHSDQPSYEYREFFGGAYKLAICASLNGGNVLQRFVAGMASLLHEINTNSNAGTLPGMTESQADVEQRIFRQFAALDAVDVDAVRTLQFAAKRFFIAERWQQLNDNQQVTITFANSDGFFNPRNWFVALCRALAQHIADLLLLMPITADAATGKNCIVRTICLCGGVFDRLPVMRAAVKNVLQEELQKFRNGNDIEIRFLQSSETSATACFGAALATNL